MAICVSIQWHPSSPRSGRLRLWDSAGARADLAGIMRERSCGTRLLAPARRSPRWRRAARPICFWLQASDHKPDGADILVDARLASAVGPPPVRRVPGAPPPPVPPPPVQEDQGLHVLGELPYQMVEEVGLISPHDAQVSNHHASPEGRTCRREETLCRPPDRCQAALSPPRPVR